MALTDTILKSIDPEIKDVVVALNDLPFVRFTEHSCWGHPDRANAGQPYVLLRYDIKQAGEAFKFHKKLEGMLPNLKYTTHDPYVKEFAGQQFKDKFEISDQSRNHYMMQGERSTERVAEFWNQFRNVLEAYKK